jgi:importin-9
VIALSKLYSLNDPRLAQISVKGDLVVDGDDSRIKTRSRAKQSTYTEILTGAQHSGLLERLHDEDMYHQDDANRYDTLSDPDRYTVIPAPLKIIKLLIDELLSASGARAAANAASAAVASAEFEDDDDDEGWEDDDDTLDLGLGATKGDLLSFMEGGGQRQPDDETQGFLTEFFVQCGRENVASFQDWYNMLSDDEKLKLNDLAKAAGQ